MVLYACFERISYKCKIEPLESAVQSTLVCYVFQTKPNWPSAFEEFGNKIAQCFPPSHEKNNQRNTLVVCLLLKPIVIVMQRKIQRMAKLNNLFLYLTLILVVDLFLDLNHQKTYCQYTFLFLSGQSHPVSKCGCINAHVFY